MLHRVESCAAHRYVGAVHVQLSQVNALQCQILGQTRIFFRPELQVMTTVVFLMKMTGKATMMVLISGVPSLFETSYVVNAILDFHDKDMCFH